MKIPTLDELRRAGDATARLMLDRVENHWRKELALLNGSSSVFRKRSCAGRLGNIAKRRRQWLGIT